MSNQQIVVKKIVLFDLFNSLIADPIVVQNYLVVPPNIRWGYYPITQDNVLYKLSLVIFGNNPMEIPDLFHTLTSDSSVIIVLSDNSETFTKIMNLQTMGVIQPKLLIWQNL